MSDKYHALMDRALPKILQMPKAKQQAIGEAMQAMLAAKTLELEASHMLIRALQADYTWWVITYGAHMHYSHAPNPARIPGCGNLDAVMRLRRRVGDKAARYIFSIKPCDPETN